MAKQTDSGGATEGSASVEYGKELARELYRSVTWLGLDEMNALLGQGADPNHTMFWSEEWNTSRCPPLHDACHKGVLSKVKTLIDHGAGKDVKDKDGLTPFHHACLGGRKDVARYLVEDLKCDVDVGETDGASPLGRVYDPDVALYLINLGCTFDDMHKAKVLRLACRLGNLTVVKELVEQQHLNPNECIQMDQQRDEGQSPLNSAIENTRDYVGHVNVALYLINHDCPCDDQQKVKLLCKACRMGMLDVVKELVEQHHVNPNVRSTLDNWTPLHHACSWISNKELVEYLVEKANCDVNVTDDKGRTPLKLARANHLTVVVDYLKTQKAPGRKRASKSSDIEKPASKKQKQETVAGRKRSSKSSDVEKPASKKQKQDHGSLRTPQRECPNCGDSCHIRCKSCPHCEHQFQSSAKKQAKPNDEPKKRTRKK